MVIDDRSPREPASTRWPPPPDDLTLEAPEAHVWVASLDLGDTALEEESTLLSKDERRRADRFQFIRDRNRFIARRAILRRLAGRYLRMDPAKIKFDYDLLGKPRISSMNENPPLEFNLSHSDGLALFGFALHRAVGIDLERIRPIRDFQQIATSFFHGRESSRMLALPRDHRLEAFFGFWTGKEAFLKATGDGLFQPLDAIELAWAPDDEKERIRIAGPNSAVSGWEIHSLDPSPGYLGALVTRGLSCQIKCWGWKFNRGLNGSLVGTAQSDGNHTPGFHSGR